VDSSLQEWTHDEGHLLIRFLRDYKADISSFESNHFAFHILQLTMELARKTDIWTKMDVELTFTWLKDLQRVGYRFPSLEFTWIPSLPLPVDILPETPFAIAEPVR
jgi:hypothetical protein